MLVVNAQSASYIDVFHMYVVPFELVLQVIDAIAECLKVTHVENLASNVEVKADELHVFHFSRPFDDGLHVSHSNAELVLSQSCRNICVCVSSNVRINSERHSRNCIFGLSQFVDDLQFGYTLDIEGKDAQIQAKVNLPVAFPDSCVDNFACWKPCPYSCLDLPSADTVGSQSCLTDDGKHLCICICFDGIVHAEAFVFASFFVDNP